MVAIKGSSGTDTFKVISPGLETTVFDNGAGEANTLTGAGGENGTNWFMAKVTHTKTNRTAKETLN